MRKTLIFIISVLFFVNREKVIFGGIMALDIWSKTLFPLLYPTFIINDLIMSSGLLDIIIKYLGRIYSFTFRLPKEGIFVFIMSLISGSPTNAKNLKTLYSNNIIEKEDVTKILCTCYFFNPLFIITFTNITTLIYLYIANILASIITNIANEKKTSNNFQLDYKFNLSSSIESNINIMLNILGTLALFIILSSIIPIDNVYLKTLISGILELTTGLNLLKSIKAIFIYRIILATVLSLGGFSIIYQIKSILKDTSIDFKYFIKNRIICALILLFLFNL